MPDLQMFIPITKVDAAKRLVYGVATAETKDRSGEICDYAGTKPLYEKWSGDIHKASDGKSLGNVRAMHGKVAAGKVTEINFNDEAKQIEICAKVVDDAEWAKVEEGVYTGFSQGGSYVKRWKDDDGLQRYIAEPVEVSLVDVPCLASATFQFIKADGATLEKHFTSVEPVAKVETKEPTNDEVAAKAREIAKAAGNEEKWADHIDAARTELTKAVTVAATVVEETKPVTPVDGEEWEQVWLSKRDGKTFKNKAELRKHHEELDAAEAVKKAAGPAMAALDNIEAELAKKDYSEADRKEMATKGEAMADGSFAIANKADLENAVQSYGQAKKKAAAKRWIIKRAKALKATDVLPADWSGSTKDANKGAEADLQKIDTPELKKAATLYDVSNLISLLASLETAEECLESITDPYGYYDYQPNTRTKIEVSKELTDRFGAVLVEFGDIAASLLDEILSSMGAEEASEAAAKAATVVGLMKVGARHGKADTALIQKAHDAIAQLGATCVEKSHESGALEKSGNLATVSQQLEKMTVERDGLQKSVDAITERLGEVLKRVKNIEEQPGPGPSGIFRVVEKAGDGRTTGSDVPADEQIAKFLETEDGRQSLSLMLIKASQRNGQAIGA